MQYFQLQSKNAVTIPVPQGFEVQTTGSGSISTAGISSSVSSVTILTNENYLFTYLGNNYWKGRKI
jgi:hypothetical protein